MSKKINYKHLFISKEENLQQIMRVNHAGELGAKYIYLGQLKALPEDREILEMLEGELKHLEFFEDKITEGNYRPSILNPLWKKMAFLMGYLSAKNERKTAMLCTKEVEEVIEKHYQSQIEILEEGNFKEVLKQFHKEEIEHLKVGFESSKGATKFSKVFNYITRLGIFFSSKI
jgi:ubiquinone biosynthesis monooxygenase Coq7